MTARSSPASAADATRSPTASSCRTRTRLSRRQPPKPTRSAGTRACRTRRPRRSRKPVPAVRNGTRSRRHSRASTTRATMSESQRFTNPSHVPIKGFYLNDPVKREVVFPDEKALTKWVLEHPLGQRLLVREHDLALDRIVEVEALDWDVAGVGEALRLRHRCPRC